jgi:hypothetical protein
VSVSIVIVETLDIWSQFIPDGWLTGKQADVLLSYVASYRRIGAIKGWHVLPVYIRSWGRKRKCGWICIVEPI